jgi:hypothetical protein
VFQLHLVIVVSSILIEIPLAGKAGWENYLSIAPVATMDSKENVINMTNYSMFLTFLSLGKITLMT